MSLFTYLFSVTAVNAIAAIAAVIIIYKRFRGSPAYLAMLSWFGHSALYWSTLLVVRAFFQYTGPSVWVSTWAAAIFLHASLGIIGDRLARRAATRKLYERTAI